MKRVLDSKAFTYQGYLFNEMLVPSIGVRRDVVTNRSGSASEDTSIGAMSSTVTWNEALNSISKGNNTSWGAVVHLPKKLRGKLPLGSDVSLSYNRGKNMRVENRVGFSGAKLDNQRGDTEEFGVVISVLDEKIQLKANWYTTNVQNANIASMAGEKSTLGDNTYVLKNLEAWGAATALAYKNGMAGNLPGAAWFWNWAYVDHGGWDESSPLFKSTTAEWAADSSTIAQKAAMNDWFATAKIVTPQSWWDAYKFPLNVDKLAVGDLTAITKPGYVADQNIGALQPGDNGKVNGLWPVGLIDSQSKGVEIELVATPVKNLKVSLNVTKTTASTSKLGTEISSFIEKQWARLGGNRDRKGDSADFAAIYNKENGTAFSGKAGDLRLWWGGGDAFRKAYGGDIWAPYTFQLNKAGLSTGELSPWKVNSIASYSFDKGFLKGSFIGGGYRWQAGQTLGYAFKYNSVNEVIGLDPNKGYKGEAEDAIDLWMGYSKKITKDVNWRIQLNIRNLGESKHLVPFAMNPAKEVKDMTPSSFRIAEGMTWQLTNTFEF